MEVEVIDAEYVHRDRFVRKAISGMRFEATASTSTTAEGTILRCLISYDLPYGIMGNIMDKIFFGREMEKNVERSLDNIERALESMK